jgi:hypothetical protein
MHFRGLIYFSVWEVVFLNFDVPNVFPSSFQIVQIGTSIIQFWECKLRVGGVPKVSEFVLVMDQSM